ncbi:ABC transporter substrate-binding protein [Actinomyces vulturis]|uniref:ABC transporter substrate-binding protein n=1 Tax=Actinomyces vulturis TaxID=1857645 RepID=UPI00082CCE2D|nr:ABC transporter substrate-binding protein [Actinomyces vulturis]
MSHPLKPSRRGFIAGTTMTALAMTLAACGANSSSTSAPNAEGKEGGTLTILTSDTDMNFDPAKSQSLAITSLALVHRRLTAWSIEPGKEARVVPDLATDTGTVSDDGLTWTYTLKDNLKDSDGNPITSHQIKYGIERTFADALSGGLSYHKVLLEGAEGYVGPYDGAHLDSVETPDDKTIIFHLVHPFGDWPWIASTPAFAPVPEGDDPKTYSRKPVASGPYKVSEYQQGVSVTLARNEYWQRDTDEVRTALPDTIVFSLGQDQSVASQRLIADSGADKNAFGSNLVGAAQLAQVMGNPTARDRLVSSDPGPLLYLAINNERVTDLKVRQAISHAVNKDAVVAALGGEQGAAPASTYITPGIPGREEYNLYPTDMDKAKQLLEGADVPSNFVLLVRNRDADMAVAEAVAQSLSELGLNVQIDPAEGEVFSERTTQGDGSSYDLAIAGWNPDYPSANANIQPLYDSREISNGGQNFCRYSNAEVDAAIEEAAQENDLAKASEMWAALDKRIAEDAPSVPLVFRRYSFLRGSGVTNFFVEAFPAYPNYLVLGVNS